MGKYLRESERYKIEVLLKENYKAKDIARILDKSLATIYNEIKRGQVELLDTHLRKYTVYKADVAQRRYDNVKVNKGVKNLKIGKDIAFAEYVEDKIINEKYSPAAVIADVERKQLFTTKICVKTLYNYIHRNLFLRLRTKHLTVQKKNKETFRRPNSTKNLNARLIDERALHVNKRLEYGHWEMDTVVSGRNSLTALLVLTERQSRQELIIKLESKTQEEVIKALDGIEQKIGFEQFANNFKSITMDNGVEFLNIDSIEKSVLHPGKTRTVTFYCHPYCSSERGSNENANKLIRRFIPKGSDISKWDNEQIKEIMDWMNDYPRKLFGGLSSNDILKRDGIPIPSHIIF